jgi:hypothetical protein
MSEITRAKKYAKSQNAYYQANKDAILKYKRNHHFMKKYGITVEEFDALRIKQKFCCALCNRHEVDTPRKCLCVDHNHDTGKIRELLCESCNQALGLFYDNPNVLEKAAKYLRKHDNT